MSQNGGSPKGDLDSATRESFAAYISPEGLRNLDLYKYSGEDRSVLAKLFMNRFWNWAVTWMPLWVAPNLITFFGFVFVFLDTLLVALYCPHFTDGCEMPRWCYLVFAVSIFLYQTMDNIDGKQARRTRSSSPLGELFDHGCDSLFVTLAGVPLVNAMGLSAWGGFAAMHLGFLTFYLAHWEEYFTGILILGEYANPTEAQFAMMALHLGTWWLGPAAWHVPVAQLLPARLAALIPSHTWLHHAVLEAPVVGVIAGFLAVVAANMMVFNALQVVRAARGRGLGLGEAWAPLMPFAALVGAWVAWLCVSPAHLLQRRPLAVALTYGAAVSYLLDRLLLDRITKVRFRPVPWAHPHVVLGVAGLAASLLARTLAPSRAAAVAADEAVFGAVALASLVLFVHFLLGVIDQLTRYLRIRVFRIPYPPPPAPATAPNAHAHAK